MIQRIFVTGVLVFFALPHLVRQVGGLTGTLDVQATNACITAGLTIVAIVAVWCI